MVAGGGAGAGAGAGHYGERQGDFLDPPDPFGNAFIKYVVRQADKLMYFCVDASIFGRYE